MKWVWSTRSVPHADLEKVALEWAKIINAKSPTAQKMLKYAFNLTDDGMVGQQIFAGEATRLAYGTDEAAEGRLAFLEKRQPDFNKFPRQYYQRKESLMSAVSGRIVAVVPLRGGSKSIPRKNIKLLGGKPLCAWALEAACACPEIDQVVVSTDDAEIKAVVQGLGLPVDVLDRPESFAGDLSSSESVVLHALVQYDCETVMMIQATSPLTTTADFSAAIQQYRRDKCDSMVTGVVQHRFYWQLDGTPLNYDPTNRPMRQEWSGNVVENGAFYLTNTELSAGPSAGGKIGVYQMTPNTSHRNR